MYIWCFSFVSALPKYQAANPIAGRVLGLNRVLRSRVLGFAVGGCGVSGLGHDSPNGSHN